MSQSQASNPVVLSPTEMKQAICSALRPGQAEQLLFVHRELGLEGKRILEIGGDYEGKMARAFRALGCNWVTSINRDEGFARSQPENGIERLQMDVRYLELPHNHYDLVFGVAVLEHLFDTDQVLESLYPVLKPGGHVYLHGGPLWNSHNGHHLWVKGETGETFRFNRNNPVEDWAHLLLDPSELQKLLLLKGLTRKDSEAVVSWVYHKPRINRYAARHLRALVEASPFSIVQYLEAEGKKPSSALAAQLSEQLGLPVSEFSTASVRVLLQKQA